MTREEYLKEMLEVNMLDCNQFNNKFLLNQIKDTFSKYNQEAFLARIKNLKASLFPESQKFPLYYEISNEYLHAFHEYLKERRNKNKPKFHKIYKVRTVIQNPF